MTETKDLKLQDVVVAANARRNFDEAKMAELTASVKQFDVLEPILVRRVDDHYQLIAGERRLRAARAAGLEKIPARIMDVDEKGAAEIQMLENLHRVDLGPVEEARGLNA